MLPVRAVMFWGLIYISPTTAFRCGDRPPKRRDGEYIVPSPHCFPPSGAHQPSSTCEHLSPQGDMWTHTHTHTLTARLPHKPFTALFRSQFNTYVSPFAALSRARDFPTNHRSAYSDQSHIRLFWPITGQLILTNHRRHTNSTDPLRRGRAYA